jgi:LacI family transcriptional regulator
MTTLDDIAKRLGISKATVSKALNGREDISEAMRKTIMETAIEMGYSRASRKEKNKQICVFTKDREDSYVKALESEAEAKDSYAGVRESVDEAQESDLVLGFRQAAEPDGFRVREIPLSLALQWLYNYDEFMMRNNYAGAFITDIRFDGRWADGLELSGTPAVLYKSSAPMNSLVTAIGFDEYEGMNLAVSWLQDLGHEKIGYLSGSLDNSVYRERHSAFLLAMRENELDCSKDYTGVDILSPESLELHFQRLVDLNCTALICSDDFLAYDVMTQCKKQGLHIPEDISIIGIGDLPQSESTSPPLSSIRQDRKGLGKIAFLALSGQLSGAHANNITLHSELIRRGSVGERDRDI